MRTNLQERNSKILKKRVARKYCIAFCKSSGKKSKFTNIQMCLYLYDLKDLSKKATKNNASDIILKWYTDLSDFEKLFIKQFM